MKHMKQMDMSTGKKYSLINYNFKLVLFVIAVQGDRSQIQFRIWRNSDRS